MYLSSSFIWCLDVLDIYSFQLSVVKIHEKFIKLSARSIQLRVVLVQLPRSLNIRSELASRIKRWSTNMPSKALVVLPPGGFIMIPYRYYALSLRDKFPKEFIAF